jgi:PIN domain nuclease of toxin-antitoxin system
MSCVLDTHILVWWWTDDERLPEVYLEQLEGAITSGHRVLVSDISLWEIAMLVVKDRLRVTGAPDTFLHEVESHPMLLVLPITGTIAVESTRLGPSFPRDPADRIIGATARCHGIPLMTVDESIRASGVVPIA